jgi:hypothetical protein
MLLQSYLIEWSRCLRHRDAGAQHRVGIGRPRRPVWARGRGATGELSHVLGVRSVRDGATGAAHAHSQQRRHSRTLQWQLQLFNALRRAAEDE